MRTVVSYDDIATTQRVSLQQLGPPLPSSNQPPSKKRRIAQQKSTPSRLHHQHWDDPGNDADTITYDGATGTEDMRYEEQEEEEDESRDLTQEEIWDDSALIEAWNSATAEYEVRVVSHRSHTLTRHTGIPRERQGLEEGAGQEITAVSTHPSPTPLRVSSCVLQMVQHTTREGVKWHQVCGRTDCRC